MIIFSTTPLRCIRKALHHTFFCTPFHAWNCSVCFPISCLTHESVRSSKLEYLHWTARILTVTAREEEAPRWSRGAKRCAQLDHDRPAHPNLIRTQPGDEATLHHGTGQASESSTKHLPLESSCCWIIAAPQFVWLHFASRIPDLSAHGPPACVSVFRLELRRNSSRGDRCSLLYLCWVLTPPVFQPERRRLVK